MLLSALQGIGLLSESGKSPTELPLTSPWIFAVIVLILAYFTNPDETSFQSFLTDLSFQNYLRKLRSTPVDVNGKSGDAHILNFSNHVSIWLKTPQYKVQSCGFFTIIAMSPQVRAHHKATASSFASSTTFFFGAFGKWFCLSDTAENEALAVKNRVASSVLSLETTDAIKSPHLESPEYSDAEDEESKTAPESTTTPKRPVKATFRAGQRRSTPQYSRYHTKTRITTPPAGASEVDNPLSKSATSSSAVPSQGATGGSNPVSAAQIESDAAELTASNNIGPLEEQIRELEENASAKNAELSLELDALRTRKKEEDQARSELKSRSRALEDSKRLAEIDLNDTERKLAAAKQQKQHLEEKVDRLKGDIARLNRKELDVQEKSKKSLQERTKQEVLLTKEIEARSITSEQTQAMTRQVVAEVESLEKDIEDRKAELAAKRQYAYLYRTQSLGSRPNSLYAASQQASPNQWAVYRDNPASYVPSPGNGVFYQQQQQPIPTMYQPGSASPDATQSSPTLGFLEHRRAHHSHQRDTFVDGHTSPPRSAAINVMPSADTVPVADTFTTTFAPFGPALTATASIDSQPTSTAPRSVSLPFFVGGHLTSLNAEDVPETPDGQFDAPLSPMTPHQSSLIPSQLFNMLDDDDDENVPPSPTVEYKPALLGLAQPEEAENAFRYGSIGSHLHSGQRSALDTLRPMSQEKLIAEDDLLSGQPKALNPNHARHPLSLNPDSISFEPTSKKSWLGAFNVRKDKSQAAEK